MKRFLLYLILCSSLTLQAQSSFSYVPQDRWANYIGMDLSDDWIVTAGFTGQCDFPQVTLLDKASGAVQWQNFPETQGYGRYTDVVFAADSTIWASGWLEEADDVSGFSRSILTHFDLQGNILSHREEVEDYFPSFASLELVALDDGQLFWSTAAEVHLLDKQGNTLNTWGNPNNSAVYHLSAVSADFFLVGTPEGVYRIDASGDIDTYYLDDIIPGDVLTTAERAYWLVGNQLAAYEYTSEEEYSWSLEPSLLNFPRMELQPDGDIFIHTSFNPPYATALYVADANSIVELEIFPAVNQQLYQMSLDNGSYYLMGADLFEGEVGFRDLQHGFVHHINPLAPTPQPDIGVEGINVVLDSFDLIPFDDIFYNVRAWWSGEIQVTNFSDVPVDSFLLASPVDGGFNCAEGRYYEKHPVRIEPMSSVVVPFSNVTFLGASVDDDGNITFEYNLCVFTGAPNSGLDANPLNNIFCESFVIVDTEEQLAENEDLRTFPNPATDEVQIRLDGAWIERVQVFDISGKLLIEQSVNQFSQAKLSVDQLPKGLHVLMIYTDKGVGQQQLIIQ